MRLGALAIVVVASCSMLPKDLRASTPRTAAPTPATAAAGYRALPFALGDIDKQLSAAVLATAPRVTRPDFAMKD